MVFEPKCILVTGATSEGIGLSLARSLYNLPSQPKIIITGRRQERLDEICKGKDRFFGKRLDQTAPKEGLKKWAQELIGEHPELDLVILNAGIQHMADFTKPEEIDLSMLETEVYTNYTSLLILSTALLPHFLKMAQDGKQVPRLATVTSGLSIVPKADVPNYCATKAAVHSLTLSMRATLAPKGLKIIEIVPPLVESQLHDHQGMTEELSKFWMSLKDFTEQVMQGLKDEKDVVAPGNSGTRYEKFEAGKHEQVVV